MEAALIALGSAILGSLVGSVTGYRYNKKLQDSKDFADRWVDRKEKIYAPLYEQALAFKRFIDELSEYPTQPYVRIAIDEATAAIGSRQITDFSMWDSIKKDTRFDYIPKHIKNDLDEVYEAVVKRNDNEDKIHDKLKELSTAFYSDIEQYLDESKTRNVNIQGTITMLLTQIVMPYQPNADITSTGLVSSLNSSMRNDADPEFIKSKCDDLIKKAKETTSYKNITPLIKSLQTKVDKTVDDLRKLITKIIEDYEGGTNIDL
jgi:hypothetical protein